MSTRLVLSAAALLVWIAAPLRAQTVSLSTNILEYANLGTINVEASCGVARHWTVSAGARYNPFSFGEGEEEVASRQRSIMAGARYWPWHVFSGWWMSGKLRYQEYNVGGPLFPEAVQGDRYGGGVAGGYTYMVGRHFNLDFGLGFWAGYDVYTSYRCLHCGKITGSGSKYFILPDDFIISLSYIF